MVAESVKATVSKQYKYKLVYEEIVCTSSDENRTLGNWILTCIPVLAIQIARKGDLFNICELVTKQQVMFLNKPNHHARWTGSPQMRVFLTGTSYWTIVTACSLRFQASNHSTSRSTPSR